MWVAQTGKYLMGCGTPAGVDDEYSARHGIVQGHAYGLLDLREVSLSGRQGASRMVKVGGHWEPLASVAAATGS